MPGRAENAGNRRCHNGDWLVASRPIPQFKGLDIQMYPEFPTLLLPYLEPGCPAVSRRPARARARQTPLIFTFFAIITGIGGNTLSELLMACLSPGLTVRQISSLPCCRFARRQAHAD
jgi:hypothetical protein